MFCIRGHLTTVGILETQYIPCKLNNHHLHAQTDTEGRNIMGATVFSRYYFSFYATLSETRTNKHPLHSLQFFTNIFGIYVFAIDKMQFCPHIIIYTSQVKTLTNALISILQVVLAH